MQILLLIFMLPGLIVFDLIPKIFGFKGLINWYSDKYNKFADDLIVLYLIFAFVLFLIIRYSV